MVRPENYAQREQTNEDEQYTIGRALYTRLSQLWDDENSERGDIARLGLAKFLGVNADELETRVLPQYISGKFIPYNQIFLFRFINKEDMVCFTGPSFLAEIREPIDITKGEFIYECSPNGEVTGYHVLEKEGQHVRTPVDVNYGTIPQFIEKGLIT